MVAGGNSIPLWPGKVAVCPPVAEVHRFFSCAGAEDRGWCQPTKRSGSYSKDNYLPGENGALPRTLTGTLGS